MGAPGISVSTGVGEVGVTDTLGILVVVVEGGT